VGAPDRHRAQPAQSRGGHLADLYPEALRPEIDAINTVVYETVNNGVYRSGMATSQDAYHDAASEVFTTLDNLEQRLASRRYLLGDAITAADVRLWSTLARFDAVYHYHFKVNPAPAGGLPEPVGLRARHALDTRHPGHNELRSHQAALLHHASTHQPGPNRPRRPAAGVGRAA
jgi:hypothetical protein